MKVTKTLLALALAGVSSATLAAPVAWTGEFVMLDPTGTVMDANGAAAGTSAYTTGVIDEGAGTFTLASTDPFFGITWSTTGGTLFGAGTHTVNVNGDGANALVGNGDVTFTVGAGQLGGNINFAWGATSGIDVFLVWDVTTDGFNTYYTSTDVDGDGILGLGMKDGPFPNFNANFNMVAAVPEASTYGMMLAGLGLVGFAVRRRKTMA